MKVIVIGYPKCGTKSMYVALSKLGYKVYDYEHNYYYLRKEWLKILSKQGGTKEDFYDMYKDVDATTDMPACIFWREILEAFPDAKLIFNDRKSEEDWWKSWTKTAENIDGNKIMKAMVFLSPTAFRLFHYSDPVGRVTFGAPSQRFWHVFCGVSPTVAKKCYRNHNAAVRQYMTIAPKDQLLEFHPSDGWEPLCKFLGKPIPDEEFPHKNKGGSVLDEQLKESPIFIRMQYEMVASLTICVVVAGAALFKWMY